MSATRDGRGFVTAAFNTERADYLRMAYALALSIKLTQREVTRLSVLVPAGQDVPARYARAFDHVIPVPAAEEVVHDPGWRVGSVTRLYDLTPYEETVTLDADMLLFGDVSAWWEVLRDREIVPAVAVTYRGDAVEHNPLRESFYEIGLPDLHNGFMFFRTGDTAATVFDVMAGLAHSWQETSRKHFGREVHFSGDCALLLALRETGMEDACRKGAAAGIPRFVHMKACLQGWAGVPETERDWRPWAVYEFDDALRLTVAGTPITDPFHYHVRDFVTDTLLDRYERLTAEVA